MLKSKIVFTIILLGILSLGLYAYNWHSPDVTHDTKIKLHDYIYNATNRNNLTVLSMNNRFDITYVANSSSNSSNPYFPSIHITTGAEYNAWLHVVYTDNGNKNLRAFVDTVDPNKYPKMYPFYALHDNYYKNFYIDFYDAPRWRYGLFSKPLSYWEGHAWAVEVDHENKTIKPIGGVAWGFNLSYFKIRPICITPSALNEFDWVNDWQIFKSKLSEFTN